MPCISRPKATLSRTLRHGKRLRLCHTMTEPAPGARGSRGRAGSTMRTLPLVAGSSPPTICKSVLLPQPLGPSRHEKRREAMRKALERDDVRAAAPRPDLRYLLDDDVHAASAKCCYCCPSLAT